MKDPAVGLSGAGEVSTTKTLGKNESEGARGAGENYYNKFRVLYWKRLLHTCCLQVCGERKKKQKN